MSAAQPSTADAGMQKLATVAATGQITPEPAPELNGALLKLPTSPNIYLILNGFRCWVPDTQTLQNLFVSNATVTSAPNLFLISEGPALTSGAVLAQGQGSAPTYLVTNGVKMWIPNPTIFGQYQFNQSKIQVVAPVLIDFIPSGPDVQGPTS